MSVVQISRIQLRKGLHQDLPQLASAELGWSVDTQQLFIGNGTFNEGAPKEGVSEILTEYSDILNISNSYTFKGSQSGYTSQTGVSSLSPISHTIQQALDEYPSVYAFGAVGNGIVDDTASIQRAINEILFGTFALSQPKLRRVIHFPPGVFLISNSIKIPSHAILVGSGTDRTIIRQSSNTYPVIQFIDNNGQIDSLYGTGSAQTVINVVIQDLTLEHTVNKNIAKLDACDGVTFFRTKFKGSQTDANSDSKEVQNAVHLVPTDNTNTAKNIRFADCDFLNCTQGMIINAENVKIINCDFENMSRGIWVDTTYSTASTKNIKIASCSFDDIAKSAIDITDTNTRLGIMSIGNYFGDVGTSYNGMGNETHHVINFSGDNNCSVGDVFERSYDTSLVYKCVNFDTSKQNTILNNEDGIVTGAISHGAGTVIQLSASQTNANTGIVLKANSSSGGSHTINYVLTRPSLNAIRRGTIEILINGSNVSYSDEYTEYPNAPNFSYPGSTGVGFTVHSLSSSAANVSYTSDSSGIGKLSYSITSITI